MANQEQVEILKSGVQNWNKWREENPDEKVNLYYAELDRVDLMYANLMGADLRGAELYGANLRETDLNKADLRETNLWEANLGWANLSWADLSRANLWQANLLATNLSNAKFNESLLGLTAFSDTDLTGAVDLDSCIHTQNSYIDYHTLKKSMNLPLSFLRGCGLSDTFIKNIPSLVEQTIQFYYCFISYSTKDQEFAERLFSGLQNKGIRAWYAPHDLKAGQKVIEQIEKGIKVTDKLLLILSENSINSKWVKTEITKAYKKSKEIGKQVLFPISIIPYEKLKDWKYFDSDFGKDLAKDIREYYLLNFENWKDHDEYKKNFDKLVESLKIEAD